MPRRKQTIGEEIANATSHGVMAIFGIVALILLIIKSNTGVELAASIIFGLSIFLLYLNSTLYHSLAFTKSKPVFRRLDHISIYILIGGTFAPVLLLVPGLRNDMLSIGIDKGLAIFISQWILITIGITLKAIWIKKFQVLHVLVFLLLGWSGVFIISAVASAGFEVFLFILLGGISYTIGVIFYSLSSKVKYFHFSWHIFVALGTIFQFIAIYGYLL